MVSKTRLYGFMKPIPNLTILRSCSKTPNNGGDSVGNKLPEEPTTCCMSGCANCVWIEYADKISAYYRDGGDRAYKEIMEKVSDPNMRAFLMHELRMRKTTK